MDRTTMLGVLGGSLTSVAGLLGYVVLPMRSSDRYVEEVGWEAYQAFASSSNEYHVLVLVVPSFTAMFLGTLLTHRAGRASKQADAELFAWNVALPIAMAVVSFVLSCIVLAGAAAAGPSNALVGIGTFATFLLLGLALGSVFAALAVGGVLVAVLVGSASGYALARGVARGWNGAHEN